MSNPSLTEFMPKAPAPAKAKPEPSKGGEEMKGITLRLKRSQWQSLVAMTTLEGVKIQPYMLELIRADFERRGLRF